MRELKDNVFKLVHEDGPHGDQCSTYNIEISDNVTLTKFLEHLNPEEWGKIHLADITIKYSNGKITDIPNEALLYMNKVIKSGWANGGWSRMDYWINFE